MDQSQFFLGRSMTEINDVTPTSLNHLIGMKNVTAQVAVAIEAAFADHKKFDDALLVGPPGLGKTQLATVIAAEMASEFHEVLGQTIESISDLNALLLAAQDRSVVLIDECHEMPKDLQTALYLAIDKRRINLAGGKSGRAPQSLPIGNFTLLLATTEEFLLLQPLRDRMKLTLRFGFYSEDELAEIIRQRNRAIGWQVDDEVFLQIAHRARGTPRLALRLLQSARRVVRSQGETKITQVQLERACLLEGIDVLGLGPTEQHYLEILREGTSRLNVIASRLGLPARTVSAVTEPFLIRAGLIDKDDQGRRQLTAKGREHLQACPKSA